MPKPQPSIPGLVIGGTGSNAGKTTFTLSLLCALHARGLMARAAKTGPDYIDAAFHAALTGQPAWRELKAVRTGHVYALLDELFLVNPGMNYPEALSFMAEKLNRGVVSAEKSGCPDGR